MEPVSPFYPPALASPAQIHLDPDSTPHSIQEMSENQRSCGGESETNAAGLCLLCKATTEVPAESHRPANGQVRASGTYDFVITKDYCWNNTPPKEPGNVHALLFTLRLLSLSLNSEVRECR
ncbi:Sec24B protein [Culex quinquefasciatus]|uniref:Sec24B protein n=1 Tax=Culex quinquefasciatus TaxID=7176 RepID=B0X2B4_CULQU|nr:Sec24B protein [Culex quinquefasciatus]|eukprot:XP_001863786.1 Sec24B protein [Culex quinquefasciatus]